MKDKKKEKLKSSKKRNFSSASTPEHKSVNEVKREQSKSTKIQDTITASLNRQNETIDTMKEHINKLEKKSRERNLRIVNYNEEEGEKVSEIVADVLQTKFSIACI